jgi:hypothetical protein
MKNGRILILLCAALLGIASAASAGLITTSSTAPASGTYATDASLRAADVTGLYIKDGTAACGQSFTHTEAGDADWQLGSITFLGHNDAAVNLTEESAAGLVLRIYLGNGTSGTQVGSDISFGTGTFDSYTTFMKFDLDDADTAAIGNLTSGQQYTAVLVYTATSTTGGFRLFRNNGSSNETDVYSGGQAIYNSGTTVLPYSDATFYVEAIPEPATIGMLGLGAIITLLVRRWRHS